MICELYFVILGFTEEEYKTRAENCSSLADQSMLFVSDDPLPLLLQEVVTEVL